jgi:hypothetical protein
MIARFDITQGTESWHRIRYGRVGGTRAKGLLTDGDTLLIELLGEHIEEFELDEDSYISSDMERGYELEPRARLEINQYFGIELLECGWLQNETHELLGISPDGISEDLKIQCEIKCPAQKKHTKTIYQDIIPLDNIHQCIHAFAVNDKLETLHFCSYRPESIKPLFIKTIHRDSEVNIGTEAKPKKAIVSEVAALIHANEIELRKKLDLAIDKLSY